ncbi:N-formylkynurenine (Aryl-) formamidase [Methylocaldum marinum]|uniref:N-formylkynurenine (Aryl-) formamidase n=1 Tax=Methylocaldum marinum TaxID=1432792 RepID=A0A250KUU3_9GAMM|nr:cyclase family protein [Methylocaldum marinum]BBA35438.1 N-formylkynurenine (Aryl-) formamidase [Methylocaldum marinum]
MTAVDVHIGPRVFRIDSSKYFDLSIPVAFDGAGLSAFGLPPAGMRTVENAWFVGDTRRGGSCNVKEYRFIPHCHGTHTECVGHIVDQDLSVTEILKDAWIPATLISVEPEQGADCPESYIPDKTDDDRLITRRTLIEKLKRLDDEEFHQALVIRTLPNSPSKRTRRYVTAPYCSNEAMAEIVRRGVEHLLVDIPSVDRMDDEGRLSNHRIFWGLPPDARELNRCEAPFRTITELVFAADDIRDGHYLLELQVAPFLGDAVSSRPLIYPVEVP